MPWLAELDLETEDRELTLLTLVFALALELASCDSFDFFSVLLLDALFALVTVFTLFTLFESFFFIELLANRA